MLSFVADLVTQAPIDVVINTHADGDHCWGNQLFAGHEIVATHACIRAGKSFASYADLWSRWSRHGDFVERT
jgi:glyoxylase-like metal-dependent hydrolase (beta-lactamase superfamily II)